MPSESLPSPGAHPVEALHAEPAAGRPRVRISTPAELLNAVPYLLGFHPEDSVVIFGTKQAGERRNVTLRYPLQNQEDLRLTDATATHAVRILAAQEFTTAAVVGYGPAHSVTPFAERFRDLAGTPGIEVQEILRADGGRFWSCTCTDPACCPPEGRPYKLTDNPELHRLLPEGSSEPLRRREDLAAQIAPVTGEAAAAMRQATGRAKARATRLRKREPQPGQPSGRALVIATGIDAVQTAIERFDRGGDLTPSEAAWITVTLHEMQVRDHLWSRLTPEGRKAKLRLLTELTRLARTPYVAPAATLLAFAAWQSGNGALANIALDRALDDDPNYSLSKLLREALDAGAPPELARVPCTPEEVAALYAKRGGGKRDIKPDGTMEPEERR